MKGCEVITEPVLAQCLPFLASHERQELCAYLDYAHFASDKVIINHGDPGDFMGFVVSGKLAVKKQTEFPGKFILVALLQAGAMVGEIAVVSASPRTASVVTVEESEMLLLTHDKARQLLAEKPALGVKLLEQIILVVGARLQRSSQRLAQLL